MAAVLSGLEVGCADARRVRVSRADPVRLIAGEARVSNAWRMTAPGPLRQPAFRALVLARTVSFLGDGVTRTALVLLTAQQGAGAVTVVLLAGALPRFLGPLGGALADRWDRRTLMRSCALGQAVVVAVVAITLPPLPVLVALVAAEALLATAFNPASSSCVPQLVEPPQLTRANAMIATAFNVQLAAGPALGGLLVGLGGVRTAFAVDAATFAAAALLLGLLPPLRKTAAETSGVWTSTWDGLAYVARSRALRWFVVGTVVFVAFAAIDNVALVFLVEDELGGSATTFGLVQSCFGIGMLVGSISLGVWRRPPGAAALVGAGAGATAAGSLLTAVAPSLATAGGAQAMAGVGNGVENIATSSYVHQLVPAPMLGRVFGAVATSAQVGSSLAYVVGAPLVAELGPRGAFTVAGLGTIVGLCILLVGTRPRGERP